MAIRYTGKEVVARLRNEIEAGCSLFMPNTGMGLSAKIQEKGGADLICVSSTSWWRLKGQGSMAAFMPYSDCNALVFELVEEVLAVVEETPVITLSGPHNPLLGHREHLQKLWDMGVSGVTHMPIGLYAPAFAEQMEQIGMGFGRELEFIETAHDMNMFTFAYACTSEDAEQFAQAGADVVSAHLGATKGGDVGAATQLTLDDAVTLSQEIFAAARSVNEDLILFAHGGPLESPKDARYVLERTDAHGFIGGSAAERMPIEKAILAVTQAFKGVPQGRRMNSDG
ncbi:MAG: phosphoenolpyruvate hydrolase family protein [Hyphomicrobiales bacterium]|nr:phosphoenolpyruvate hydrolase family protein [Hyphomicrobiales bacterium]